MSSNQRKPLVFLGDPSVAEPLASSDSAGETTAAPPSARTPTGTAPYPCDAPPLHHVAISQPAEVLVSTAAAGPKSSLAAQTAAEPSESSTPSVSHPVPNTLLVAIRDAEHRWYQGLSPERRAFEDKQHLLAQTTPLRAFESDLQVGRYRVTPTLAVQAVRWAESKDLLKEHGYREVPDDEAIVRDLTDPVRDTALVAIVLRMLRDMHAHLRTASWTSIANTTETTAMLYGGLLALEHERARWTGSVEPEHAVLTRLNPS